MITMDITTDLDYFKEMRRDLNRKQFQRVINSVERRATRELRREVALEIASRYTIRPNALDTRLNVSVSDWSLEVWADTKGFGMHQFIHSPRENQRQRHLQVTMERGRREDQHPAFLIANKIFARKTKRRYPVEFQFGLSAYEMGTDESVADSIANKIAKKLGDEIVVELR